MGRCVRIDPSPFVSSPREIRGSGKEEEEEEEQRGSGYGVEPDKRPAVVEVCVCGGGPKVAAGGQGKVGRGTRAGFPAQTQQKYWKRIGH